MTDVLDREQPVEVTEIDRGLRQQWIRAMQASELPLHRALTMNLIAVGRAADAAALGDALERFLRHHPCRAFLVHLHDEPIDLRATLAARIDSGPRARQVVLEQIRLCVDPGDHPKVPSLVRPLLVNDIPTQLFWAGPLPDDLGLFRQLGELADHVSVDSSLFDDPARELARAAGLPFRPTDLTWLRLCPWRRALAEAFELVEWNEHARTEAQIACRRTPGSTASGVLLQQWLEARLRARVRIEHEDHADGPELEPLELVVGFDAVEIRIRHRWPERQLRVAASTAELCLLPFDTVASSGTRGDLLSAAADR